MEHLKSAYKRPLVQRSTLLKAIPRSFSVNRRLATGRGEIDSGLKWTVLKVDGRAKVEGQFRTGRSWANMDCHMIHMTV